MKRGKVGKCSDAAKVTGEQHRHFHSEAIKLGGDAHVSVEETPDYWIIADTGLTTEGVMNLGFKPRDELAKTWILANGIAFSHDHPRDEDEFGVIVDLRRVGGFVDNVRFDDATGNVVGDVFLARVAQEGLAITEENIKRNAFLVDAIKAGEEAEVSIGFWSTDEWNPGNRDGADYEWIQRDIVYDHLASVPLGACSWGMGCGLGRHQNAQSQRLNAEEGVRGNRAAMTNVSTTEKPEAPHGDCAEGDGDQSAPAAAAPSAPAKAPAGQDAALKAMRAELDQLQADRRAEQDAQVLGRKKRLAQLLDAKVEDLPKDLTLAATDAWISREEQLQGKSDPPLVTGDGTGKPKATWNMGEEQDGVTMTPHGMTVTDWGEAEKFAQKASGQNGWTPVRLGGGS